jgi:hypothetical protein
VFTNFLSDCLNAENPEIALDWRSFLVQNLLGEIGWAPCWSYF